MKLIFPVAVMAATLCWLCPGCKKNTEPPGAASLTLINAVVGSDTLVTDFSGNEVLQWYTTAQKLIYGTFTANISDNQFNQVSSYSGNTNLAVYQYPDTLTAHAALYNLTLDLPVGSIHTLFLAGELSSPDTLFTTDYPPYHSLTDSVTGIRFVNLSPGSNPVSINIGGNSPGSEVSSLPYKSITPFKNYTATGNIGSYKFEIRDAAAGTLLTSYTLSNFNNTVGLSPRFGNVTIALIGMKDSTGVKAPKALLINNY